MPSVRSLTAAALFGIVLGTSVLVGCGSDETEEEVVEKKKKNDDPKPNDGTDGPTYDELPAAQLRERPWEVVSNKGETYLANVFYAERSENEQIMPWAIDGHTMIERLVYPTLGNPNLYVKADATDELLVVLRMEPDTFEHLKPARAPEGGDSPLQRVTLTEDADNELAILLVAKSARAATEASTSQAAGPGVYRIKPSKILENPEPAEMPAELKKRKTLRFVFDKAAMAQVPAGLYDVRYEVRKSGSLFANLYEYQYNAVRVFDAQSEEYTALNVTDTQVSVGAVYKTMTADRLDQLVDDVNVSSDPAVRNAAFITFNGDLHNGGSPETIRQKSVATTYVQEAKRVVDALKRLNVPIFLTAGNHDGYAATGHAPSALKSVEGDLMKKVIDEQNNLAWPDYTWDAYSAFLGKTQATPGGLHKNIVSGGFERSAGETFSASFKVVPRSERNFILYDGFYQWQKTYGPLVSSWVFGKNRYVSMNSFELRQHRRTGWGMYTVNYGGAVTKAQLEWLDRELTRGKTAGEDIVVLMHHDPRGGHGGKDFGYYFPMLEFRGMAQSTVNYLLSEVLTPQVCKQPDVSLSVDERESCLHDGLQEWMGPDEELDKDGATFFFSGVDLLRRFQKSVNARTLVLGHVHWNSLEMLQSGDPLVPNSVSLDPRVQQRGAASEAANPVRRLAWEDVLRPSDPGPWRALGAAGPTSLDVHSFDGVRVRLGDQLAGITSNPMKTLAGQSRELAILRFTSGADLSSQKYQGVSMYGYSVMHVTKQTDLPRINRATYFVNDGSGAFDKVQTIDIDRTARLTSHDPINPVEKIFDW